MIFILPPPPPDELFKGLGGNEEKRERGEREGEKKGKREGKRRKNRKRRKLFLIRWFWLTGNLAKPFGKNLIG